MNYEITIKVLIEAESEEDAASTADKISWQVFILEEMLDYIGYWEPTDKKSYA